MERRAGSRGHLNGRISAFVRNPDVQMVVGPRRLGRSELVEMVAEEIVRENPHIRPIRAKADAGGLAECLRENADAVRGIWLILDSGSDFPDWETAVSRAASESGNAIHVFWGQDLCHQVPACLKGIVLPR